ncbi:hypothetical protein K402DRAFT_395016 [Aulographum hederae CBS 113979]|uniref:Uncharacterized protein n=1 Tax=Aulographum hederae CBS 113979 TaxID=1176131 RepID=A0A6G1GWI6_9PEZI|nr:hypothetical protein K402DRAFT_395016 [Aulographum hederae CBS 113979]
MSLYKFSIKPMIRHLEITSEILKKGVDYAAEKNIQHEELLQARLIEDMKPLVYQIQRISDTAKGVVQRVAGAEAVSMPDDEVTFDDLQKRIQKTLDVLNSVKESDFEGKEDDEVIMKLPSGELKFTGYSYITGFALPNFYFHVTTAYDILRIKGVPVGKADFLSTTSLNQI